MYVAFDNFLRASSYSAIQRFEHIYVSNVTNRHGSHIFEYDVILNEYNLLVLARTRTGSCLKSSLGTTSALINEEILDEDLRFGQQHFF